MQQINQVLAELAKVSPEEASQFSQHYYKTHFERKQRVFEAGKVANEVFFINKGMMRLFMTDRNGNEFTCFFALENTFIADYTSFLLKKPGAYTLEAMEDTEAVVLPRECIEGSYENSIEGNRAGRVIAERYFVHFDQRVQDFYLKTPKERYDQLVECYPQIYNRAPQHMIASYLNISPVHLRRLKSLDRGAKS